MQRSQIYLWHIHILCSHESTEYSRNSLQRIGTTSITRQMLVCKCFIRKNLCINNKQEKKKTNSRGYDITTTMAVIPFSQQCSIIPSYFFARRCGVNESDNYYLFIEKLY